MEFERYTCRTASPLGMRETEFFKIEKRNCTARLIAKLRQSFSIVEKLGFLSQQICVRYRLWSLKGTLAGLPVL
jgi:hypothetical protein